MVYISTRDKSCEVNGCEAVIQGISRDGGLFVPKEIPFLGEEALLSLSDLSYVELAAKILALWFPEIGEEKLKSACEAAYAPEKFGAKQPVRLAPIDEKLTMLELWHGPTLAFKDMALQLLPHLLTLSLEATGDSRRALILTATSGDTGKAALEGFTDVPGTEVAVFYPAYGVSEMQRLQMVTHRAANVRVFPVDGNFDDTQTGVKNIFADREAAADAAEKGVFLSSANSINIGRLAPQIVYYIYGWLEMVKSGRLTAEQPFDVAVPTGNFGNILAAWFAKEMGVPIRRLICASNRNNILTDFFETGLYDTHRPFHKTSSPSMDILVSSNLERLLFYLVDRDDKAVADMMQSLKREGSYRLLDQALTRAQSFLTAAWADEAECERVIGRLWQDYGYAADPHTAVAMSAVWQKEDDTPTLIASTASPYKFSSTVLRGIGKDVSEDEFHNLAVLADTLGQTVPEKLDELRRLPVRFDSVHTKQEMPALVREMF